MCQAARKGPGRADTGNMANGGAGHGDADHSSRDAQRRHTTAKRACWQRGRCIRTIPVVPCHPPCGVGRASMPSALRPEPSASVLQRVMVRGLERRPIFRDDLDQADCLARLAAVVAATGLTVSTWALRAHHAHLLGRLGLCPLAVVVGMQPAAVLKGARRKHGRLPPAGRCWRMIARSLRMQRFSVGGSCSISPHRLSSVRSGRFFRRCLRPF